MEPKLPSEAAGFVPDIRALDLPPLQVCLDDPDLCRAFDLDIGDPVGQQALGHAASPQGFQLQLLGDIKGAGEPEFGVQGMGCGMGVGVGVGSPDSHQQHHRLPHQGLGPDSPSSSLGLGSGHHPGSMLLQVNCGGLGLGGDGPGLHMHSPPGTALSPTGTVVSREDSTHTGMAGGLHSDGRMMSPTAYSAHSPQLIMNPDPLHGSHFVVQEQLDVGSNNCSSSFASRHGGQGGGQLGGSGGGPHGGSGAPQQCVGGMYSGSHADASISVCSGEVWKLPPHDLDLLRPLGPGTSLVHPHQHQYQQQQQQQVRMNMNLS